MRPAVSHSNYSTSTSNTMIKPTTSIPATTAMIPPISAPSPHKSNNSNAASQPQIMGITPSSKRRTRNNHPTPRKSSRSTHKNMIQTKLTFPSTKSPQYPLPINQKYLYHQLFPKFKFPKPCPIKPLYKSTSLQSLNGRAHIHHLARTGGTLQYDHSSLSIKWMQKRKSTITPFLTYSLQPHLTTLDTNINTSKRKSYAPQRIKGAISSTEHIQFIRHQKILHRLHKTNTIHKSTRTPKLNVPPSNNRHLRNLNVICWNTNGGLNINYQQYEQTMTYLGTYPSTTIIMSQESIGTKNGYHRTPTTAITDLPNMHLAAYDPYCVTTIHIHDNCQNYIPIQFPESIYHTITNPINRIHASAVVIQTNKTVRSRNEMVLLNLYRSPNSKPSTMYQITRIIQYIQHFLGDQNPNIIIGGDLNIWSEEIGSDPHMRFRRPDKFKEGDKAFEIMNKLNIININNGSPTMWKKLRNGIINEYCVDTLWISNGIDSEIAIHHHFDNNTTISDHYPNHINIQHLGWNHTPKIPGSRWNINTATRSKWNKYRQRINSNINQIYNITKEQYHASNDHNKTNIINTALKMLCDTIYEAAEIEIGRTIIPDIHKPWITAEIVDTIKQIRNEKKGIVSKILNRIKKLKRQTNGAISKSQIQQDLQSNFGAASYAKYTNWVCRNRNKVQLIKRAKKIYQNKKVRQLATRNKSRYYYRTLDEISNIGLSKHQHMPSIIKPSIAVKPEQLQPNNIKKHHLTQSSHDTAVECNKYFNTIGTTLNPNYKSTLLTNRKLARQFDAPFDIDTTQHPNYQQYLDELSSDISLSTLKYHTQKLKNNKKVYDYDDQTDNIHTIIIKESIPIIGDLLLIIFNHWKNTAEITPGANTRALILYKKYGKSPLTIKGYRPLAVEKIIWKLYQIIINNKIQKYLHQLRIISIHQYAGKKGVGSEDCIMALSTSISNQHLNGIPTHIATFDSSDAYDAQHQLIIYDKFKHHAGFDNRGIIMLKSLIIGRRSLCMVNGIKSHTIETRSGPYQGSPPASTIWCVYINPLLCYIQQKMHITNNKNMTIAKIQPFAYMDDITVITYIMKQFGTKYINNKQFPNVPIQTQQQINNCLQQTINTISWYLSINNIPQNEDKTKIMTIHEYHYQPTSDTSINITSNDIRKWYPPQIQQHQYDHLHTLRNAQFTVQNKTCTKVPVINILGIHLDELWSFSSQIQYITNKMKLVRYKCSKLIRSNRNALNMDTISTIIRTNSLALLHYGGNIWLNQQTKLNTIRSEYHKSIKLLCPGIPRLSINSILNFHSYPQFDAIIEYINAKTYSKVIRVHDQNGLSQYKNEWHKEWDEWEETNAIMFDHDDPFKTLSKSQRLKPSMIWYLTARKLNLDDVMLRKNGRFLQIPPIYHIPDDIPDFIHFDPVQKEWRDEDMNDDDLYIFIDASVYFTPYNYDPRSRIYGTGGAAMIVYHRHEHLTTILSPLSTRTHINTMELEEFHQTFMNLNNTELQKIIIKYQIQNIHIISDSRNCINIIRHNTYPDDAALIQSHQLIETQLRLLQQNPRFNCQIYIHWVHSHSTSNYNNEVDGFAKAAASIIGYTSTNYNECYCKKYPRTIFNHYNKNNIKDPCTCTWNPNSFVAYTTIKKSIKYQSNLINERAWFSYRSNRATKWASHYDIFNISYDRRYGQELHRLSQTDNTIRIMLYTNHLPLNLHEYEIMENKTINPLCDHPPCKNDNIYETLHHYLFTCPRYKQQREQMVSNVKCIYNYHNILVINSTNDNSHKPEQPKRLLPFINDPENPAYAKQFIFPDLSMESNMRINIIKEIIKYVQITNRFPWNTISCDETIQMNDETP